MYTVTLKILSNKTNELNQTKHIILWSTLYECQNRKQKDTGCENKMTINLPTAFSNKHQIFPVRKLAKAATKFLTKGQGHYIFTFKLKTACKML